MDKAVKISIYKITMSGHVWRYNHPAPGGYDIGGTGGAWCALCNVHIWCGKNQDCSKAKKPEPSTTDVIISTLSNSKITIKEEHLIKIIEDIIGKRKYTYESSKTIKIIPSRLEKRS